MDVRVTGKDMVEDVERLMQGGRGSGMVVSAYLDFQETKTVYVVEIWSTRDEAFSMRCVEGEIN